MTIALDSLVDSTVTPKLRDRSRIFGTVFATKREDINRVAETRGVRMLSNLNGGPS